MELLVVKGLYEVIPGEGLDVEMIIFANDENEAKDFFIEYIEFAPTFTGDWWEEEDIKTHTRLVSVEKFDDICFEGKKVSYTTPLIGGGYYIDGYGMWDEMKNEMIDRIDDNVGKIARFYVEDFNDTERLFFMKNKFYRKSSINAINSCVRRGIDPFGY